MEDVKSRKNEMRADITTRVESVSHENLLNIYQKIDERLFEFANFMEANIVLLYLNCGAEVATGNIIRKCYEYDKLVVFPLFNKDNKRFTLVKVDDLDGSMRKGPGGVLEPNPARCKVVPLESLDIAIIPGIAFDEKGGRLGTGGGYYDRLIPKIPITARKVSLACECQLVQQVPVEPHDRHVDIIITEKRIIYKI